MTKFCVALFQGKYKEVSWSSKKTRRYRCVERSTTQICNNQLQSSSTFILFYSRKHSNDKQWKVLPCFETSSANLATNSKMSTLQYFAFLLFLLFFTSEWCDEESRRFHRWTRQTSQQRQTKILSNNRTIHRNRCLQKTFTSKSTDKS